MQPGFTIVGSVQSATKIPRNPVIVPLSWFVTFPVPMKNAHATILVTGNTASVQYGCFTDAEKTVKSVHRTGLLIVEAAACSRRCCRQSPPL
jgi:hypothetical protein